MLVPYNHAFKPRTLGRKLTLRKLPQGGGQSQGRPACTVLHILDSTSVWYFNHIDCQKLNHKYKMHEYNAYAVEGFIFRWNPSTAVFPHSPKHVFIYFFFLFWWTTLISIRDTAHEKWHTCLQKPFPLYLDFFICFQPGSLFPV